MLTVFAHLYVLNAMFSRDNYHVHNMYTYLILIRDKFS